jgi:uncharacterized GH25 family protein
MNIRPSSKVRHACALLLLTAACHVQAHDFWVQPQAFQVVPSQLVPFTLQVGHGPYRQRSPIAASRIVRFQALGPSGGTIDLRGGLHPGDVSADGEFRLQTPGTHLLVLETDNRAQSHLPSVRFNDYLKVEGLSPALERRTREHRMDVDETEIYSRHAKVIVQTGGFDPAVPTVVTKPVGLVLEIVPGVNPSAVPRPGALPLRVLYQGRPLPGATVKLTNLDHDESPVEVHVTDSAGSASFAFPASGQWLLNVIWTRVLPADAEADYETDFSSLSFGVL